MRSGRVIVLLTNRVKNKMLSADYTKESCPPHFCKSHWNGCLVYVLAIHCDCVKGTLSSTRKLDCAVLSYADIYMAINLINLILEFPPVPSLVCPGSYIKTHEDSLETYTAIDPKSSWQLLPVCILCIVQRIAWRRVCIPERSALSPSLYGWKEPSGKGPASTCLISQTNCSVAPF